MMFPTHIFTLCLLHLSAHHTPRSTINNAPAYVPGLELSPGRPAPPPGGIYTEPDHVPGLTTREQGGQVQYMENRILTPSQARRHVQTAEFGVQTGGPGE